MIHYHGTPMTPRSDLYKLAGKCFCVPWSDPRDADTCLSIGQAVMFDNGRFSAFTQRKTFNMAEFFTWIESRLAHPHWAVVPDVIDGTIEEQKAELAQWSFPKWMSTPVWHMGLSINYLLELAETWPRICFGSTAQYWQIGSDAWDRRCEAAFNALARVFGSYLPWIHMLRGLSLCGDRYPFASADSVNVARNFKDARTCPERMARRIDAIQCPGRWIPEPQLEMFA